METKVARNFKKREQTNGVTIMRKEKKHHTELIFTGNAEVT